MRDRCFAAIIRRSAWGHIFEKPTAGTINCRGKDINTLQGDGLAEYRSLVQAVFQDPTNSLNPRMRIKDIIAEPVTANNIFKDRREVAARVLEVLQQVGLGVECASFFPHEFSGEQRQRPPGKDRHLVFL